MPGRSADTGHSEALGQVGPVAGLDTIEPRDPPGELAPSASRLRPSARRMQRGAHRCLIWVASFAAVLILVIAFGLWRLVQGPVELGRLTPYVEEALNQSAEGYHVAISGVRFAIDRGTRQLELQISGVHLSSTDGEPIASFSEISTGFSLSSLLRGRLTPTRLVVERPVLRFVRDQDGKIGFRFAGQDADAPGFGPEILAAAADPPQPQTALGSMRKVVVRDATLHLDDERTGRHWQADSVDATLERTPDGLAGDLSLATLIGARTPEIHASYRYWLTDRMLDFTLEFGAVEPAAFAALTPDFAPLAAVEVPISGTVRTRIDLAGATAEGFRVDLGFGEGSLKSALLPEGAVGLKQGELHAVYAPESGQLRLAKLDLDLGGGAVLAVKGSLDAITPELIAGTDLPASPIPGKLAIELSNVPVAKFQSLWPPALSPGGRRWVLANIRDGVLDQAAIQLDLAVDTAARSAEIVSARGSMRYHDLTISYFGGLAPVRKVSGTATMSDKQIEFTPTAGMVKSVHVTGGVIRVTDLGAPVEWQTIDLALSGPIRDVLEVIDVKPLRYAHDVGLDPARVAGRTDMNLHFKLPLLRNLKFDDVEFGAKANLTGVAIARAAMERDLSDGGFAVDISRPGVHLQGKARFDGIPISLDGGVMFKPKNGVRSRYRVALRLDDAERRRLDIDYLPDRINGPMGVDLTYSAFDAGRAQIEALLDLSATSLSVAEAGWNKAPDVPGAAKLVLDLANEQVTGLREIEVKSAGLYGKFTLALTPDRQQLERVDVARLVIGDDDVAGSVARRAEGGWRVDLRGQRLDLTHWLKSAGKENPSRQASNDPPLLIDARLGQLILGPRREVRDLSAHLLREGEDWRTARIDARFVNGRQLKLRADSTADARALSFHSDDLGSTLSLLDVTDNVVGGRVTVTGQFSDGAGKRIVRGHIEGEDYSLVRAPAFAQILSLASLSGVGSMLSGTGIPFTTLRGDFGYSNDHLLVENLLAYGGAIGVTANGVVRLSQDRLDLQGTIVPAYALNSILGNIPVIGSLLLGGEGQGLFAANYRATGSAADPQIKVNPLSALTPGFLRRLFQPNFGIPPPVQESLGAR